MMGPLDRQIALLADRAAIADCIHHYARAMRHGRAEDSVALFTQDGCFEIRDGMPGAADFTVRTRLDGRAAIAAYLIRPDGSAPKVCPLIHNILIELDGDVASASCVMETQVLGTDHRIIGEYADSFLREAGVWKFSERIYTIFKAG
jgi:hypothetical protein